MGFTAVQISPIVKNIEEHTAVGDAYHGYWSVDNYALNDRFGTPDDFKKLVDALHKRDMLLMVDVVVNNMVQGFDNVIPPKVDYSKFNPFNDKKYFHPYCNVTEWEDAENYQNCWLYPYGVALADLATETPAVSDELNSWVKGLVSNYSIDGLRIDAAKHINDEFLPKFAKAAGVFSIGEVLSGVTEDMCRYQTLNLLEGMPNYLEYYPLTAAFNGGSFEGLAEIRNEAASGCTDVFALGSFVENHDMPRFASTNEDPALAANAMTYILLNDGIPTGKAPRMHNPQVTQLTPCSVPGPGTALQGQQHALQPRAALGIGLQQVGAHVRAHVDAQQAAQPRHQALGRLRRVAVRGDAGRHQPLLPEEGPLGPPGGVLHQQQEQQGRRLPDARQRVRGQRRGGRGARLHHGHGQRRRQHHGVHVRRRAPRVRQGQHARGHGHLSGEEGGRPQAERCGELWCGDGHAHGRWCGMAFPALILSSSHVHVFFGDNLVGLGTYCRPL